MFLFERTEGGAFSSEQCAVLAFLLSFTQREPYIVTKITSLGTDLAGVHATDVCPVGSVEFVRAVVRYYERDHRLQDTWPGSYPTALRSTLHRPAWTMTLGAARHSVQAVFVKPAALADCKAFTGQLLAPGRYGDEELRQAPDTLPVWCVPPVTFLSEYRAYVLHGRMVGLARYDLRPEEDAPQPDLRVIRAAIQDFTEAPASYALDFGVLATGETALVECNDGWALGYYRPGITPAAYTEILKARWQELVQIADSRTESPIRSDTEATPCDL